MHKRWFALILMIAVIPGCTERRIETEPSEALYETKPRDDLGFSSFYAQEDTVRTLPPDIHNAESFQFLDEDIVVFSGYPETRLTLLDGNSFAVKENIDLPINAAANVTAEGITYTDERTRELVFLDSGLHETKRIPLPEDCGAVFLSSDGQLLYYCTPHSLRVLDLVSKTDRPVKEMHFPKQEIIGLHCSDSVIECSVLTDDGQQLTLFVSAETGMLLYETVGNVFLRTENDLYFTVCMDGTYRQLLCGATDFGPSVLMTETDPVSVTPVLSRKLVLLHNRQPDGSWILNAYHPETGIHTAQTTLPGSYQVADIQPDPSRNGLWLLCRDTAKKLDILYSWDTDASAPENPQSCLQPRWDHDNPDLEGLEQCQKTAEELSAIHGVQIRLWTDIPAAADWQFEPEYQIPLLRRMLRQLDGTLSKYPVEFLQELAEQTGSGRLNICLARSISPSDLPALLYWDQREVYLILTPTPELEQQIHRLLFDLIDCRVLGISDTYDSWDRSDPSGSGHRERIRILEAAMSSDQTDFFASDAMQAKLLLVCQGIRETFRTAKPAESLPWEQYLAETP